MRIILGIVFVSLIFVNTLLKAEGTREASPLGEDSVMLFLTTASNYKQFALYGVNEDLRLNISVCDSNEIIYFGFQKRAESPNGTVFQIRDANDIIVYGPTLVPNSGTGFISDYAEAVAGPSDIAGPSGYNAFSFQALVPGDYYIEFNIPPGTYFLKYFDITVANPVDTGAILGRVWSKTWQFSANDGASCCPPPFVNGFHANLFIYADDGIVTSVDFNGFSPAWFSISSNQTGTANTGNLVIDRQSVIGNESYGQYRIFLNEPDSNCFPTGVLGGYNESANVIGCFSEEVLAGSDTGCITINANVAGPGELIIELNETPGYQANSEDRLFVMNLDSGKNCIEWDLRDGFGNKVASGDTIQVIVRFFSGLTHLPMNDIEYHPNGYKVKVIRPVGPNPELFWDDSQLPTGTIELAGCTNPSGCHSWVTNDQTTCPPAIFCPYGNENTVNTWWFASEARDTTFIIIPTVTASSDSFSLDPNQGGLNISTPSEGVSYEWTPAIGLSCTDCKDPIASPEESTVYSVKITDADGCIFYDTVEVEVLIPVAVVPSAFSPNGDNMNDVLFIEREDITSISYFRIYDRWGKLVFETEVISEGWDGTRKGKPMNAGMYIYEFEVTSVFGDTFEGKGQVALIR